jgi:hypothetical protein
MLIGSHVILYPVLTMVLLTFITWTRLYATRVKALKSRAVRLGDFKTTQGGEIPAYAVQASDHFANLFEIPVLFYVLAGFLYQLELVNGITLTLCWSFVVLRYVHSYIHLGYNDVMHRYLAYLASCVFMWAGWVYLAVKIFLN